MSARSSRFSGFGSSRRRVKVAAAVMACSVMFLAGCGGSGGSAAETAKPVPRGVVAGYAVTFDVNGGQVGCKQAQTANSSTPLSANTCGKFGRVFTGWATTSNGDVVYQDKENYPFTKSATLFAVYGNCSESPVWTEYDAKRTSQHNAEVSFEIANIDGVNWLYFIANTESDQSGINDTGYNSGKIQVQDLNANSRYSFTVTGTNDAGCSYTSPPDPTPAWGGR